LDCFKTGVYCWRNLVNGKIYVGGAYVSLLGRLKDYRDRFARNFCHNRHFLAAWNLYGSKNFRFRILERCAPSLVQYREDYWLTKLDAANPEIGYNICPVAKSRLGVKHTEETRKKMSLAKKGKPSNRLGKPCTEETKAKIRAAKLGKKMSDEARAKMSITRTGKKMSDSHREAYIAGHWSRGPNAKAITEKIRQASTGITKSEETRKKISNTKIRQAIERDKQREREA
jgi:group I intron endonuclease